ncbi:MAG: 50S ribosomal protein L21 [Candidatus Saccharimonadales bacterium]
MKKAVIVTGGHQYLVAEGETIDVELVKSDKPKLNFEPLLVIDGAKTSVGAPSVAGVTVAATIVEADVKQDKVTSIRYKAKKRVRTVRGHRQRLTTLKIDSIK